MDAKIRLGDVSQEELDSLAVKVNVVSNEHTEIYLPLQHALRQDDAGHYLVISSRDALREPVLRLVVELNWSTGQLIREYALIIDPQ